MAEFECDIKEYCESKNCENCVVAKQEMQMQNLHEAVADLREGLMEIFAPICEACINAAEKMVDAICCTYPNSRVVHLALHHPKERVRKKNRHRIFKWISKVGGNND